MVARVNCCEVWLTDLSSAISMLTGFAEQSEPRNQLNKPFNAKLRTDSTITASWEFGVAYLASASGRCMRNASEIRYM